MLQAAPAPPVQIDDTLARAQAGDSAAFADIVRQHEAMVFSLARHFARDRSAAEDLAQDVFLDLYRNLAKVESAAHLTFWLRRVTSHRCIDRLRREARRVERSTADPPEQSVPPATRDVLLAERLRLHVAELPADARLVVTLRYQEDLTPLEIAEVLEMSVNTVKSHLRRSLDELREKVAQQREWP